MFFGDGNDGISGGAPPRTGDAPPRLHHLHEAIFDDLSAKVIDREGRVDSRRVGVRIVTIRKLHKVIPRGLVESSQHFASVLKDFSEIQRIVHMGGMAGPIVTVRM